MKPLTFYYVSCVHRFYEKCEPKAIEAVKLDKLSRGEMLKNFNDLNVRVTKQENKCQQ